jgi:short subunit dehydrogenase-like uncharacterized protein
LIYGAYGYTGELLAAEAVRRGHRPTLAGRSRKKLQPLAERLGLPMAVAELEDARGLRQALEGHALVLHAAGPFVQTSLPMMKACLEVGAHYLDITGEIPVFEQTFAHDAQARHRGVALIPGVGFDVVPTDCLAAHVADHLPDADALDIAFDAAGSASAGTLVTTLGHLEQGGMVRRGGELQYWPLGKGAQTIRFSHEPRMALPIPWGDLVTAFHTTGIPEITIYMALPPVEIALLGAAAPLLRLGLHSRRVRDLVAAAIRRTVRGPDEASRTTDRCYVWARARNARGESKEAWLETAEAYRFTSLAGVRAVEKTLESSPRGALTPSRAFGTDFALELEGTRRFDALPGS